MPSIEQYLDLLTSEYRNQPDLVSVLTERIQGLVDLQNALIQLPELFDLDSAIGQQLDYVGQWIGLTRRIVTEAPVTYFSWGVPGAGWGQSTWMPVPAPPTPTAVVSLSDSDYRTLLKARVLANTWDGTKAGAYAAWNTLFNPRGYQVLIQEIIAKPSGFFSWGIPGLGWENPNGFHRARPIISPSTIWPSF